VGRTALKQLTALVILYLAVGPVPVLTQSPSTPALAPVKAADYGKWESLGGAVLADNGKWMAVPITRVEGTSELNVYPVPQASGATPAKPWHAAVEGSAPAFSADAQWLAYRIGYSEADREKMQDDKKPVRDKLGLVRLDAGAATPAEPIVVSDITRFAFAPAGPYLAMLRYLPEGVKRKGADLLVRNLVTGGVMTFGSVSEFTWQDEGRLLALAIDAEGKAGNGVQLYDPQTGGLRLLDSGDASYTGLTWRAKSDDLAVFKSRTDDAREEDTNTVLAWRGLAAAGEKPPRTYDQAADKLFPQDMRIVTFRRLQWSKDAKTLYFGVQEWDRKPAKEGGDKAGEKAGEKKIVKPATVDVWHTKDERIIPMQRVDKTRDLERNYLSLWNIDGGKWLRIGTDKDERVAIVEGDRFATETDRKPYMFDNMFDRTRQDVYLVDLTTGARTKVVEGVWYFQGDSPAGNYLLYFKGDQYWTYDIRSGKATNLTAALKTSWTDPDYDTPVRVQKPPSGVGGWLKDDAAVLLYDQHDIWRVAPDGSGGVRLTRGAEDSVVHRYVRLNRDEEFIDPASPVYVSLYGRWSKKFGYARVPTAARSAGAVPAVERLVWFDKSVGRLAKAKKADIYAYVVQDFDDSPDYMAGGPTLADARQVTATNAFQAKYAWGRSSLVEYKNVKGERLQGALYYPAGYEPGRKYPMIVYVYERLSQGVHGYAVPSERSPYNAAVFTANGYFVLQPDIVFRPRDPGLAAVDCVTAAVKAVLATGAVDPKRVGLVGHSWGGYEASFIPTQTNIFAASIAGAPITDFLSFYGAIHWNQGLPEPQHFETGQARMDVPYWVDLQAYIRNSSTLFINKLETPMMIFFGDKDGTVDFRQGVEMYNYARRAGKQLVMLVYAGENHSAREKPNQIDYHRRILQWFDHYLKGAVAPDWITKGTTVIDAEKAQKTGR
jgi:acetyl esterase/lipase